VLSGSDDKTLRLWDVATGQLIRTFQGHSQSVNAVAFSPDGRHLLSASEDKTLKLWDARTGEVIRTFDGHDPGVPSSVAFSPDGARVLSSGFATPKLWDVATGQLIRVFEGHWPTDGVWTVAFSPDGTRVLSGSQDMTLKLWDAETGRLIRTFEGHVDSVISVAFSPDDRRVASSGGDSTVRVWNLATGDLLSTLVGGREGEWLTITPAGFFASSPKGAEVLSAVRGLEAYSIAHFYNHLYRPDLVEQLLKGDPEGKYADAASTLNLAKILGSGPPPQIEKIPERKTERAGDTIKVTLRLVDTGGGIGEKVVWRVNGVTQGDISMLATSAKAAHSGYRVIAQTLKINPSTRNVIEVIAYNAAGLLATEPWRTEIDKFGEGLRPRMHVLAVGVSEYAREDWRLGHAATDAKTLGELLNAAARGLYDDVKVTLVLDAAATAQGIEAVINQLAASGDVRAGDVFVLFLAGHGRTVAGTYYFLPQDLSFEGGRTVMSHGIGHDRLQSWLAKLPAQKSILILDTCESATATRSLDIEQETAIDRLRHATGRSVIAAAGNAAFEGYEGHGLLTHTILDAFKKPEAGYEEEVDLYQLAAHIDRQVPMLSQRVFGVSQRPHNKIEGNFPLGVRTAALLAAPILETISKVPTHVLIQPQRVRPQPTVDAQGERELHPGVQVRVIQFDGPWAFIARDGQRLGYVPAEALLRLQ